MIEFERCKGELQGQLTKYRKARKENQTKFWERFGVTQSTGCRFEKGLAMPETVAILVHLYMENKVSDVDLKLAKLHM